MIVRFTAGTAAGQCPLTDYIQDSVFRPGCIVEWVQYNGNNLTPLYWVHEPSEWRLCWGDDMLQDDDILVSVNCI